MPKGTKKPKQGGDQRHRLQSNLGPSFVLNTIAHNEEKQIEQLIQYVIRQSILPKYWIITSDGSTDRTDEIVQKYAARLPWIKYKRLDKLKKSLTELGMHLSRRLGGWQ